MLGARPRLVVGLLMKMNKRDGFPNPRESGASERGPVGRRRHRFCGTPQGRITQNR